MYIPFFWNLASHIESIIRPHPVGKDSLTGLGLSTGNLGMSPLNLPDHRPTRPSRAGPNRGPNRGPTRPNFGRQRHPDQPEKPIGQGCVATSLAGEEGIFVAGTRTLALFYPVGTECRIFVAGMRAQGSF